MRAELPHVTGDPVVDPNAPLRFEGTAREVSRVLSRVFVVRHVGITAFATCFAILPQFGQDRLVLAGLTLLIVVYDIGLHLYARRRHTIAASAMWVYPIVPAAIVAAVPEAWIPAVAASVGNLGLIALTFPLRTAALATVLGGLALGLAGANAGVNHFAEGIVAFSVTAPILVAGVDGLFRAFRASEQRYREYVENANDMIYTHDLETLHFTAVNEAALRITRYSREEIGDITVADIVAPEHLARAATMIQQKVEGEATATTYELEILTKDGQRVPVEVSTRVIRRRGEPVAIQGIARDISERRQVEAQRAALDRARSEFIANAAHELRTPLTTLSGLASVLAANRASMSEEEIEGAVDALRRQGKRARLLADRLLDLSALELGRIAVQKEPVSVADSVERAVEFAPPPEDVILDLRVDGSAKVIGDPIRIQEILGNLLTNAYRYGGPHVQLLTERRDGRVHIEVRDDGPGVPVELLDDLFQPFVRAATSADGTGLGLAICARLAEALDGTIRYDHVDGGGARFRVTLPALG